MLVTVLLWASAFVAIRHAEREFSGGSLSLGRLLVASGVLGLVVLLGHPALAHRAHQVHPAWHNTFVRLARCYERRKAS
ncbi:MAG: hypothetical protein JWN00_2613 [Actinomycetia bacterium]|nr:hypothetical protein [Actinomycetes bacterium]